jgi:hypothetical protein
VAGLLTSASALTLSSAIAQTDNAGGGSTYQSSNKRDGVPDYGPMQPSNGTRRVPRTGRAANRDGAVTQSSGMEAIGPGLPVDGSPLPPAATGGQPLNDADFADVPLDDGMPNGSYGGGCDMAPCRAPIYFRGEYLAWWLKGDSTPALVTTSPDGTTRAQAGVLSQPGTSVLFGDQSLNNTMRSGARLVLGAWLDPTARIEGEWFGLSQKDTTFDASSTGSPILARPFFNLGTGAQDSHVVAFPSQLQGSVHASETSSFQGAGLQLTENLLCWNNCTNRHSRLDFLYGFRYLRLRDNLTINDSATSAALAATLATADAFATSNQFYGATMGLMSETCVDHWCFTAIGRLALGATAEHVSIDGSTTVTPTSGTPTTSAGGLLAMPMNIGNYSHEGFTVVPQLELKLGYDLTSNLRFTVGYDVIYWSRVARPGQQIDTFVNTSQASGQPLVGTPGPLFALHESDLWIQGINVGGEYRF